jgi:putrescine importer
VGTEAAEPQARTTARAPGLRPNAIGLIGFATLGAVMMSPALGIYGSWGPMASTVGFPVALVFLGALVVSLPTAISYALVNRELPSAGSAFTWTWKTTSAGVGTWVGLMMILYSGRPVT